MALPSFRKVFDRLIHTRKHPQLLAFMVHFSDYEGKRRDSNPWSGTMPWAKTSTMMAFEAVFQSTFGNDIEELQMWGPKGAHPVLNNASRQLAANFKTQQSTTIFKLVMGYAVRLLRLQFSAVELSKPVKLPARYDTLHKFSSDHLEVCFTFCPTWLCANRCLDMTHPL